MISYLEVFMVGTDPKGTRVCLGCFCGSQDMFKTGNFKVGTNVSLGFSSSSSTCRILLHPTSCFP